jgi:hypothetical protein
MNRLNAREITNSHIGKTLMCMGFPNVHGVSKMSVENSLMIKRFPNAQEVSNLSAEISTRFTSLERSSVRLITYKKIAYTHGLSSYAWGFPFGCL